MKVLITGAGGMVGKNILECDKFTKHQLLSPNREQLNLFSYENTLDYLEKEKPDIIIHCAARVGGIQANIKNPVLFLTENLDINRNIILAAKTTKIKKLINLGSSCMYPKDTSSELKEDMILSGELEPTNEGYALSKIVSQRLCHYIRSEDKSYLYKTVIPCNLYGKFDNFSPERSHLVPAIIKKIHEAKQKDEDSVEIWGDGTARREFMYAADLADFLYKMMIDIDSAPDVINAGLGKDYSVNEYYRACAEVIGYKGSFFHNLDRPTGMKRKLSSVALAKKFGWTYKTELIEGLEKTYRYFLENKLTQG